MTRLLALAVVLVASPCVADDADHWAWKKPVRAAVPAGARNPIDALIGAQTPRGKPATREALLRRATFGLTGLPPTPEETAAFVADTSPGAWEKVVDRLLASPRYGERWARHWLDLARYADTNGYEFDEPRHDAWRYRDYVIRSLNADKPYDRFVTEHLAGDEAFPGDADALTATGFNLLGPDMTDASDQAQRRLNTLNDMTDTAGLVFLGLTITCARCHDHKFEPLPQTDYFRLQAFFTPAAFRKDLAVGLRNEAAEREYQAVTKPTRDEIAAVEKEPRRKLYEAKLAKLSEEAQAAHRTPPEMRTGGQQEQVAETERLLNVSDAELTKALSADERMKLDAAKKRLKSFDAKKPAPPPVAFGLTDRAGPPEKTYLLERGELSNRGAEVRPGFPVVLGGKGDAVIEAAKGSTGRRLALAKWVTSPDHPLTARVLVNRLWQHHFGRGIVATASDFGVRGERPTHPELLDFLATELTSGGWKLKRMQRLILLSNAYRQAAVSPEEASNGGLLRPIRARLEGEAVRDTLLMVSGRLNEKAGGPGVVLPEASKAVGGSRALTATADVREHARRSVYLFSRRNLRLSFLEAFDLPDSNLSCPKRERSTTATQSLALLNADEVMTAAKATADRLTKEAPTDANRIDRAYRLTLGRAPTKEEQQRAAAFLKDSPLSELCRALFNLNEFVYLD